MSCKCKPIIINCCGCGEGNDADHGTCVTSRPYEAGMSLESAETAVLYNEEGNPIFPVTSTDAVLGLNELLEGLSCSGTGIAQRDFYVSASGGSDEEGEGTEQKPWKTIQFAVDKIADLPQIGGIRTLHVGDGNYVENVLIENMALNITGNIENPSAVKIGGTTEGRILQFISSAVNLSGLQFVSTTSPNTRYETFYSFTSTCRISDCIASGNSPLSPYFYIQGISMIEIARLKITVTAALWIFYVGDTSYVFLLSDITIENSMTVTAFLILQRMGAALTRAEVKKIAGTITGKIYDVQHFGRFAGTNFLPSSTIAGTTTPGGAVQTYLT